MAKLLRCRDVGVDCDWEVCGLSEDEVMTKGAEHARVDHGRTEFSPEEIELVRTKILEVDSCPHMPQHVV
jgi:predicted small metal-binding protein